MTADLDIRRAGSTSPYLGQVEGQGHRSKFAVTGGNESSATAGMADRGVSGIGNE